MCHPNQLACAPLLISQDIDPPFPGTKYKKYSGSEYITTFGTTDCVSWTVCPKAPKAPKGLQDLPELNVTIILAKAYDIIGTLIR